MRPPDPLRLAAADMYGRRGATRRRQIVRIEFSAAAIGSIALGLWALLNGRGGWEVLGGWLLGIGTNYVTLALKARALARPGVLERAVADRDAAHDLRQASRAQLWILMPFALPMTALTTRPLWRRDRSSSGGR